jgi:DNA (cytosine-5)-methyltransferase 1
MNIEELKINSRVFINHVKENYDPNKPLVFWIDLFCGAGGTSTGIHLSNAKNVFVAACVNHDANAIKSHSENHPFTLHFTEDIRDFAVVEHLVYLVTELRKEFPECKIKIWASLECTNFSKAKGGLSRDADSRTLAEHMFMYMILQPDVFWFENVREFMAWGPLDKNGKPESRNNGRDYLRWVKKLKSYGYDFDAKILNAADFGAYQSRERLFLQFPKKGYSFAWPEQTHTKKGSKNSLFDIPKWKAVRDVLDLKDEGQSIFSRKKPLSENTEKRILAGLKKFVAKGDDKFIKKYYSGRPEGKVISVDGPAGTVRCSDGQAIVKVEPFSMQYNSGNDENRVKSLDEPVGTITTGNSHAIVTPESFITQRNSGDPKSKIVDINGPARTITQTAGNQEIVTASHLNTYYGNGGLHSIDGPSPSVTTKDRIAKIDLKFLLDYQYNTSAHSMDNPSPTLLTKDKFAKVDVVFIDQQYGNSKPSSIDVPLGTLTGNPKFALVNSKFIMNQYTNGGQHTDINGPSSAVLNVPKQNLVSADQWIMDTNFNNIGSSVDEPSKTLIASRRHPYLVNANSSTSPPIDIDNPSPSITQRTHLIINPSWFGHSMGVDEPSCTIIARQDKSPLYLMAVENGSVAWIVFEDDSETMIEIKRFMVEYGITDIKMRMLKIPELLQIQGFPKNYKLIGTQTEQKKYIGNAVEVNMAKALAMADYELELQMAA